MPFCFSDKTWRAWQTTQGKTDRASLAILTTQPAATHAMPSSRVRGCEALAPSRPGRAFTLPRHRWLPSAPGSASPLAWRALGDRPAAPSFLTLHTHCPASDPLVYHVPPPFPPSPCTRAFPGWAECVPTVTRPWARKEPFGVRFKGTGRPSWPGRGEQLGRAPG